MHASVDQLLSLADEAASDAIVVAHVADCAVCRQRLAAIESTRRGLRELAALDPGRDLWFAVQHRLERHAGRRRLAARLGPVAAVASLGTLAILFGWRFADHGRDLGASAPAARVAAGDSVELRLLREQSLSLEQALAGLPARPAVGRATTSLVIDDLEAQVQWIDHRLGLATAAPPPHDGDAAGLWRERVEVMDTLVQLRLVESQRTAL